MWAHGGQVLDRPRTWYARGPRMIHPGNVVAGDPRWHGTKEHEKRKRLAKRFYETFRRDEDDEARYARLARVMRMKPLYFWH